MKLEIDISEKDAACIWQDCHQRPIQEVATDVIQEAAARFRNSFPGSLDRTIKLFRDANPPTDTASDDPKDDLLKALEEAIYVADEVHDHGCAAIKSLVPCDCWLSRAKAAVAQAKSSK